MKMETIVNRMYVTQITQQNTKKTKKKCKCLLLLTLYLESIPYLIINDLEGKLVSIANYSELWIVEL